MQVVIVFWLVEIQEILIKFAAPIYLNEILARLMEDISHIVESNFLFKIGTYIYLQ